MVFRLTRRRREFLNLQRMRQAGTENGVAKVMTHKFQKGEGVVISERFRNSDAFKASPEQYEFVIGWHGIVESVMASMNGVERTFYYGIRLNAAMTISLHETTLDPEREDGDSDADSPVTDAAIELKKLLSDFQILADRTGKLSGDRNLSLIERHEHSIACAGWQNAISHVAKALDNLNTGE
jgi:hypothetical protein